MLEELVAAWANCPIRICLRGCLSGDDEVGKIKKSQIIFYTPIFI
jgi:hypothetical protein